MESKTRDKGEGVKRVAIQVAYDGDGAGRADKPQQRQKTWFADASYLDEDNELNPQKR